MAAQNNHRLLLFNLRTDADDHILGFTTTWINALADHYTALDVLTMHQGRLAIAPNVQVYSVGREKGYSEIRRVWEFYRLLGTLLQNHRYQACFAHMMPLFAAMGGPLLSLYGVPTTLWYTHRQANRTVAAGLRMSRRVVTAVPSSFPFESPKVRPLGHGVDTDFYTPAPTPSQRPIIVQVARLTAIKHQHILLQAIAHIPDAQVVLVGDIPDGYDDGYKRDLIALIHDLKLAERVTLAGAQTPIQVRDWYHQASIAINLSPPGLFDKAALESMAAGVPTIVSNAAFEPLTTPYTDTLHIPAPDATATLVERLTTLLAMPPGQRQHIGHHLRQQVIAQHSLQRLMIQLVAVLNTGETTAGA